MRISNHIESGCQIHMYDRVREVRSMIEFSLERNE
jgi:hypothetical protein